MGLRRVLVLPERKTGCALLVDDIMICGYRPSGAEPSIKSSHILLSLNYAITILECIYLYNFWAHISFQRTPRQ